MKGFISSIFAAFAFVALGFSLEESATSNLRTKTCEDISELAPFYQVYIPSITAHIYTIYDFNITSFIVGNPGTTFLGVAAFIFANPEPSTVPFFCLRSATSTAYFYTTNQTERDAARASGFTDFMTVGYIYPTQVCGTVPLYRLHFVAANADYMYTTSAAERDNAVLNLRFIYEGVAGYVFDLLFCGTAS
ncbi:hypothetical protein B0H14DRAFT_2892134 [Mycena olivaceomarginata]|nr:hypothetical protein B0H14DRAFT_2892134 [Mycena olivaceomarginata]